MTDTTNHCSVEVVILPTGDGRTVPGLRVTCQKCGYSTESFGQRGRSLKRCLKAMTAECPLGESNTYKTI
jgi:hypothetical protein